MPSSLRLSSVSFFFPLPNLLAELYISSDFESHNPQPSTIIYLEVHLHLWCWRRMCCGERKARETESVAENWSLGPTVAKDTEHTRTNPQSSSSHSSSPQELASLQTRSQGGFEGGRTGSASRLLRCIETINQSIHWGGSFINWKSPQQPACHFLRPCWSRRHAIALGAERVEMDRPYFRLTVIESRRRIENGYSP